MEGIMPFESIAYLTFVLSAVVLFAVALTYAEWASKRANDPVPKPDLGQEKPHPNETDGRRKAA
jgi:hypothetical protein